MFTQTYFYLYVVSSVLVFCLENTMKRIHPANGMVIPFMGAAGLITKIANLVLLVLCLFFAPHWWYALIMWGCGYILSILIPPTKVEMVLGYIAVICSPLCTLFAYMTLFEVI